MDNINVRFNDDQYESASPDRLLFQVVRDVPLPERGRTSIWGEVLDEMEKQGPGCSVLMPNFKVATRLTAAMRNRGWLSSCRKAGGDFYRVWLTKPVQREG
jgi:hypothetical protein